MSASVVFRDRAWWLYVSPDVSIRRLITIEDTVGPILRDRLIEMVRARLEADDDAA